MYGGMGKADKKCIVWSKLVHVLCRLMRCNLVVSCMC
jgi:hypothetical protein